MKTKDGQVKHGSTRKKKRVKRITVGFLAWVLHTGFGMIFAYDFKKYTEKHF